MTTTLKTDKRVKMNMRIVKLLPAFIYASMIFYLSSIPGPDIPYITNDKILHTMEYLIFGFLLAYGFEIHTWQTKTMLLIIAIGSIYGFTDEVHQLFVPGRFFTLTDWVADITGTTCGIMLGMKIIPYVQEKTRFRKCALTEDILEESK